MYTVLLVDDEEKILEVMKVRIGWQELGVDKLLTASDGQAALEYFEQQRIDLLVTDIRMPRMGWSGTDRKGAQSVPGYALYPADCVRRV